MPIVTADSVVPTPDIDNEDGWTEHEMLVNRITAIVKIVEGEWSVTLGKADLEWILECLNEDISTDNDIIADSMVTEFAFEECWRIGPPGGMDPHDYESGVDPR